MAGPLFIAPEPNAVPLPAPPPVRFGPCTWLINDEGDECGKPGVDKIKADSRIQKAMITVCTQHKAENNQKYAELRAARKTG